MSYKKEIFPSPEVSSRTHAAIAKAMEEEKNFGCRLWMKTAFIGAIVSILLSSLLYIFWAKVFSIVWISVCLLIWMLITAGFGMYYYPQVRLSVPTYWGLGTFARIFIAMIIATVFQLALCPHFALFHLQDLAGPHFLNNITSHYLHFGGMEGCSFLCGATFALLSAVCIFLATSKTLIYSNFHQLFLVLLFSLIAEMPVAILQISHDESRRYFLYWLIGNVLALSISLVAIRELGFRIMERSNKNRHAFQS